MIFWPILLLTMVLYLGSALFLLVGLSLLLCTVQLWLLIVAPAIPRSTYWLIRLPYRATAGLRRATQADSVPRSARLAAFI